MAVIRSINDCDWDACMWAFVNNPVTVQGNEFALSRVAYIVSGCLEMRTGSLTYGEFLCIFWVIEYFGNIGPPWYMVNGWKPPLDFHSTAIQLPKLPFGFHSTPETFILTSKMVSQNVFSKSKWKFWKSNGSQTEALEVEWMSSGRSKWKRPCKFNGGPWKTKFHIYVPAATSIYVCWSFCPLLCASMTFNYLHLLPSLSSMSFLSSHFSSGSTKSSTYRPQKLLFTFMYSNILLSNYFHPLPFLSKTIWVPPFGLYFVGNVYLRPQALPFTLIRRLFTVRRFSDGSRFASTASCGSCGELNIFSAPCG